MSEDLNQRVIELERRVRELEDASAVSIDSEQASDVMREIIIKDIERHFKPGGMFC